MIHELKVHKEFFSEIENLNKKFEVRKNDRNFQMGDFLALNEMNNGEYTGRSLLVRVIYILDNPMYCKPGMVIMSIQPCRVTKEDGFELIPGRKGRMQILDRTTQDT